MGAVQKHGRSSQGAVRGKGGERYGALSTRGRPTIDDPRYIIFVFLSVSADALCFRAVRACVRPSLRPGILPVSTIPYKPMDGSSPHFC